MVETLNPSNYFFNHHAVAPAFVGFLLFSLSFYILLTEKKTITVISYFLVSLSMGIWLTGIGIQYLSKDVNIATIWVKYYVFLGVVLMPFSVYFYTSSFFNTFNESKRYIIIVFLISIFFYTINITTNYILGDVKYYYYGYYPAANNLVFLYVVFHLSTILLCFRKFFVTIKEVESKDEKHKTKNILIGLIIAALGNIDWLPAIGVGIFPFGYFFIIIWLAFAANGRPWLSISVNRLQLIEEKENENFKWEILETDIANRFKPSVSHEGL